MTEDMTHKNNKPVAVVLYFLYITVLNYLSYIGYRYIVDELQVNDNGYLVGFFLVSYVVVAIVSSIKESNNNNSITSILFFIYGLPFFSFAAADIFMLPYFAIREIWHQILNEFGRNNVFIVLFGIGIFILYFVPSIIAFSREHHNKLAIFFTNLFLGWTVIGWIFSIVWSGTSKSGLEQKNNQA